MIAKITRGSRPGDIGAYLHGPGRKGEHYYREGGKTHQGGVVIGGNLLHEGQTSEKLWARDLRLAASGRPDAKRPIWHMSLRCAPEDRTLTNAEWAGAVQEMGERMGWANHPHVIVRHGDDHVHVVVSRVAYDGTIWAGKNDARAAQQARQHVEKRLGLRQVPTRAKDEHTRRDNRVTQGEYRKGVESGKAPERVELAYRVAAAADAAEGLGREAFEAALTKAGVEFQANVASTGRVSGYRFHQPGHTDAQGQPVWWKASQLDRELSWAKLQARLGQAPTVQPAPIKPKGLLESRASYEQRAQEATDRAVQAVREQIAARVQGTRTEGAPVAVKLWWRKRHQNDREASQLQGAKTRWQATFGAMPPPGQASVQAGVQDPRARLRQTIDRRARDLAADDERIRRDEYRGPQGPHRGISR